MKTNKIIYWVTTILFSAGMLMSSFMYLTHNPELMKGFALLGYPLYFVNILGSAKLLGAIALVVPAFPKVKEWAYAGFTFCLIGAVWTHLATHTPFVMPLVFMVVLGLSYVFWGRTSPSPSEGGEMLRRYTRVPRANARIIISFLLVVILRYCLATLQGFKLKPR